MSAAPFREGAGIEELTRFLCSASAQDLILSGPALGRRIPELLPEIGFDQHSPHHAYDVYTHTAHVTASVPPEPALRWAALLHDVGKIPAFTQDAGGRGHFYGHAGLGADMAGRALFRLEAPEALRSRVVLLIRRHMDRLKPDPSLLMPVLTELGPEALEQLLQLQEADMNSKGTGEHENEPYADRIRAALAGSHTE